MTKLLVRVIDKIQRLWYEASFRAITGSKPSKVSVLGKIYVRNPNVYVGENVTLYPGVMFQGEGKIIIGDDTSILNNTIIYSEKDAVVKIGSHCSIAPLCHIVNAEHVTAANKLFHLQGNIATDIIIEDDVLITSNVTILRGSTIRKGSVIGAKSLVRSITTEPYGVYVGIPARLIKYRS